MVSTSSFRLLSSLDIISLEEDIDRAVEAVSVRDIRAINPTLVAELFDGDGSNFSSKPKSICPHAAGKMPSVCAKIGKQPYLLNFELLRQSAVRLGPCRKPAPVLNGAVGCYHEFAPP